MITTNTTQDLTQIALNNPRRFKVAAGIYYKTSLISWGVNQYKTHPIMLNKGYKEHQVFLHAEADAIRKFLQSKSKYSLEDCSIHVLRLKRETPKGKYVTAMAKPCKGCMNLITTFGIKEVYYTEDNYACEH